MRVWCVVFHCTVVGFYSSAVRTIPPKKVVT
eukprot:COSAG02_NODE_32414_length_516_cov_1.731415_1_plen_30_part_10